jgi:hypothetical protein
MLDLLKGNVLSHQNGSINWMSTDSPDKYEKYCNKSIEFKNKWENIDISYILNSQGYRCPEWDEIDWQESVVIFGDSCIAGVGVPINHTVSSFLQTALRRPVINLGVSGSSNIFSLYNMLEMKKADISPYAVISVETGVERTLTFSKQKIGDTGINHWGSWNHANVHHRRFWLENEENYLRHSEYIKETKKLLWKDTKYIGYDWSGKLNPLPRYSESLARDNLHPGMESYAKQAKHIKKDWIENGWMD